MSRESTLLRGRWRGSRQENPERKADSWQNRDGQTDQMPKPVLTIDAVETIRRDDHLLAEPAMEVMHSVMIKAINNPISEIKNRVGYLSQIFSLILRLAPQTSRDWARESLPAGCSIQLTPE